MSSQPSPFTEEHITEWRSFGPPFKTRPTTETERSTAALRKRQTTAMKKRLATQLNDPQQWTEKKIEKELERLVHLQKSTVTRPSYLDPPSGTRDFYPPELRTRDWLFQTMEDVALSYGFQKYDAPVLEHVELYERKAGEEITSQMYDFHDKEGDHVTLRPEMTPTLARLVLNRTNLSTGEITGIEGGLPLKWFSIPQCWRFETTQRGRKREHYQWNMDVVGVDHVHAEVELLAAASAFFRRLGIGPDVVGIKINSRRVLEVLLARFGVRKQTVKVNSTSKSTNDNSQGEGDGEGDLFAKVCIVIDKLDKIGGDAVKDLLSDLGIPDESSTAILKALNAPTIEALAELATAPTTKNDNDEDQDDDDDQASRDAIQEVQRLFQLATEYGFADYLVFDASVVRGLAYYTGIVWEAFDRRGELRAIMGGGRYDRLLELYGGSKCTIPCVGFGFGDCVIMELLRELGKLPDFSQSGPDYVVCAYDGNLYGKACWIASKLREHGSSVDLMPTPKKKVANSFRHADVSGARRMVFVAPDEVEKGVVRVKDLRKKDRETGEAIQVDVPLDSLETVDVLVEARV